MQLLLEVKDNKAFSLLEVLKGLSYVKTQQLTPANAQILRELKEAVENMKLVAKGKLKPKRAEDLLNEL